MVLHWNLDKSAVGQLKYPSYLLNWMIQFYFENAKQLWKTLTLSNKRKGTGEINDKMCSFKATMHAGLEMK